jgi:hypothetical protein
MDVATKQANRVTVSIVDDPLTELKAEIADLKAELVRWLFLTRLGGVALNVVAMAVLNTLQRGH